MQIVRLQCPACGAAFTVPAGNAPVVCDYCGSRLAIAGGGQRGAPDETAMLPQHGQRLAAPETPPAAYGLPAPVAAGGASNLRGCLFAVIAMFVVAPLLTFLAILPFVPFLPEDAAGQTQTPDALAACFGLMMFLLPPLLAIYAFVYFRRSQHSIGGFFVAPVRGIRRLIRR